MPWPAAVNQLVNHFDHFHLRSIYEHGVARIWISCRFAALALPSAFAFSYLCRAFHLSSFWQYDPLLLQSYISGSLLADLCIFVSATTVFHNVCSAMHEGSGSCRLELAWNTEHAMHPVCLLIRLAFILPSWGLYMNK